MRILMLPLTCSVLALLFKVFGPEMVGAFIVSVLVGFVLSRASR